MKSAKEWAESVVTEPQERVGRLAVSLEDSGQSVELEEPLSESMANARGIIERLVERVQVNARAPLDEEIARLKTRNDYAEGMVGAYEGVITGVIVQLSKSLEPGADTAAYVREVVAHLKGLITL